MRLLIPLRIEKLWYSFSINWKEDLMTEITLKTPPQVEEAQTVLTKLDTLTIGQTVHFYPPLCPLVVHALYMLLGGVDKGWRITPPKDTSYIPQTIAEIQRTR